MKLALHQGPAIGGATEETFGVIQSRLAAAAAAGARMIVFPELFLPGYNRPDLHGSLAQPQGGAWCERLSALTRAAGCGLTIGWPTANPAGFEHVSALLVPARAVEMGITIAYANYCGREGDIAFTGRSVIAGPDGQALAAAGPGEALLVTDLAATAAIPQTLLSRQLDDYRTPQP